MARRKESKLKRITGEGLFNIALLLVLGVTLLFLLPLLWSEVQTALGLAVLAVSDVKAPSIDITQPPDNSIVDSGVQVKISVKATDSTGVKSIWFVVSGVTVKTCSTGGVKSASCNYKWLSPSQPGSYFVDVYAVDSSPMKNERKKTLQINVQDVTPPSVVILSPEEGFVFNSGQVLISASATDASGVSQMRIFLNGALRLSCAAASCSQAVDAGDFPDGTSTIRVEAVDALNNVGEKSASVFKGNLSAKPNIVFILTDDMALDDLNHMPKTLSLLGDAGVTFSNYFVTYSLCCPSRSSILRGQYTHNHKVFDNHPPNGGFSKFKLIDSSTVATWLSSVGYKTAYIGKYLNEYNKADHPYVPPGWAEWNGVSAHGDYYDYAISENGVSVNYGSGVTDYMTDVISAKALDFLDRSNSASQPLFLYLAPYAPHEPATSAERHKALFKGFKVPRVPSYNETDLSDKPSFVQGVVTEQEALDMDRLYRKRLRSLQAVDEMVEAVVNKLSVQGKLDNTYIFFSSDNGFHLGHHTLEPGKKHAYEEDVHLPLLVRVPNFQSKSVVSHLVLNNDLAPTFAEIAGVQVPSFVDGRSFAGLINGVSPPVPQPALRKQFAIEQWEVIGGQITQKYAALRNSRYKYVEWYNGEKELYDLSVDPYEIDSIHASADPLLLSDLSGKLSVLKNCVGVGCVQAEDAS